jgi:3-phenylpropionate/trans-cinnamate dioxygenase ferredoxin subunit
MSEWFRVCKLEDLADGKPEPFTVDDYDVVLIRRGEKVYAMEDNCSHQDFPLSHGKVLGEKIKCSAHGAEFSLETGQAMCAPAFAPVRVFNVKLENGEVLIATD